MKNTINDVKQIDFPVKFDFPVLDYWQILQLYSDFCNYATIDDLEKVELFILLIHSLNNDYKKYANVGVDIKLSSLLKSCNISNEILSMSFTEIDVYLRGKFNLPKTRNKQNGSVN